MGLLPCLTLGRLPTLRRAPMILPLSALTRTASTQPGARRPGGEDPKPRLRFGRHVITTRDLGFIGWV